MLKKSEIRKLKKQEISLEKKFIEYLSEEIKNHREYLQDKYYDGDEKPTKEEKIIIALENFVIKILDEINLEKPRNCQQYKGGQAGDFYLGYITKKVIENDEIFGEMFDVQTILVKRYNSCIKDFDIGWIGIRLKDKETKKLYIAITSPNYLSKYYKSFKENELKIYLPNCDYEIITDDYLKNYMKFEFKIIKDQSQSDYLKVLGQYFHIEDKPMYIIRDHYNFSPEIYYKGRPYKLYQINSKFLEKNKLLGVIVNPMRNSYHNVLSELKVLGKAYIKLDVNGMTLKEFRKEAKKDKIYEEKEIEYFKDNKAKACMYLVNNTKHNKDKIAKLNRNCSISYEGVQYKPCATIRNLRNIELIDKNEDNNCE